MGKRKSRYGNAYVAFPSISVEAQLDYELLKLEKED